MKETRNSSGDQNLDTYLTGRCEEPLRPVLSASQNAVALHSGFGLSTGDLVKRSQRMVAFKKGHVAPKPEAPLSDDAVQLTPSSTLSSLSRNMRATQAPKFHTDASANTHLEQQAEPQTRAAIEIPQPRTTYDVSQSRPSWAQLEAQTVPPIKRFEALGAWLYDLFIAACIFAAVFYTAPSWSPIVERKVVMLLQQSTWSQYLSYYLAFSSVLHPLIASLTGVFLVQFFALTTLSSTTGRSFMGIVLDEKSQFSIVRVTLAALSETLSFGGLTNLPFIILSPSRVPLFPWIRFKK